MPEVKCENILILGFAIRLTFSPASAGLKFELVK
jgi:hypothetical protein